MLRAAADVGVAAAREQRVHGAAGAQQLQRAVGRCEAEPRLECPRALVQVGDREAAARPGHGLDDRAALGGGADAGGKSELAGHDSQSR